MVKKVRDVVPSRDMLNTELLALDAVLQPMETHVHVASMHAFRQARRDRLAGQAHGDLIVTEDEGGGLRVPQVVEDEALVVG